MWNKEILISYIPVLHSGYLRLFEAHRGELYLIGDELIRELAKKKSYYGRDIRALKTKDMATAVRSLNIVNSVSELTPSLIRKIKSEKIKIIAPDEDITRDVIDKYFKNKKVKYESIFLRWDRKITEREHLINPDHRISKNVSDKKFMKLALSAAGHSPDWWRQIGAMAVKGNKVLYCEYNRHMPSAHSLYALGDPKNNYDVGEGSNYYTSIHAEAAVIARAAHDGTSLSGASFYATTFPCPTCARLLSVTGIKKLYYAHGHSALDAEPILKGAGVEIIYVPTPSRS